MKHAPVFPDQPFCSLEEARAWVGGFVVWYNEEHRHSGIRYVTPGQRHRREDVEILLARKRVYEAAKKRHPERWTGETRNWDLITAVSLNLNKQKSETEEVKKAA